MKETTWSHKGIDGPSLLKFHLFRSYFSLQATLVTGVSQPHICLEGPDFILFFWEEAIFLS